MATEFQALRQLRQDELSDAERAEYAHAYAASGLAAALAELVYILRTEAAVTQTELARRMGTTQPSIARIESGGSTPTLDLLDRLGKALDAPLTLTVAGHAVTFGAPPAA